ncbi:hypothetical protein Tco_0477595 [Tanacetum coccineum]
MEDQRKLVKALSIVHPDPIEPDKEEEIKKAEEEAKINDISKPEVICCFVEEAKKEALVSIQKRQSLPKLLNYLRKLRMMNMRSSKDYTLRRLENILSSKSTIASMVKSPKNARFNMKLRKLIAEHLDQEKLQSKKVKLEALGYKID